MPNDQKKRRNKRIEKQYMTRFRIRSYEAQDKKSANWNSVILKNVSAGGALFSYNKNLDIGTPLDLKINISKDMPTVNCVGKIIRSDKPQPSSMFCFAIKFIDIGEKEKELLNTTVDKHFDYKYIPFLT